MLRIQCRGIERFSSQDKHALVPFRDVGVGSRADAAIDIAMTADSDGRINMNIPSNGCICDLEQPRYFGAGPYDAAQDDKSALSSASAS